MENTLISTKEKRYRAIKVANECLDRALNNMCGLKQNEYNLIKDLLEALDCEVGRLKNEKPHIKFHEVLKNNPISAKTSSTDADKNIKDYLKDILSFNGNQLSYRKYQQGLQQLFEAIEDMISAYILSYISNGQYNHDCFEIKYGECGDQNNFTTFNENGESYLVCTQPKWYSVKNVEQGILALLTNKISVNRFCENIIEEMKRQVRRQNGDIVGIACIKQGKLRIFIDSIRMKENIDTIPEEITYDLMIKMGVLRV